MTMRRLWCLLWWKRQRRMCREQLWHPRVPSTRAQPCKDGVPWDQRRCLTVSTVPVSARAGHRFSAIKPPPAQPPCRACTRRTPSHAEPETRWAHEGDCPWRPAGPDSIEPPAGGHQSDGPVRSWRTRRIHHSAHDRPVRNAVCHSPRSPFSRTTQPSRHDGAWSTATIGTMVRNPTGRPGVRRGERAGIVLENAQPATILVARTDVPAG